MSLSSYYLVYGRHVARLRRRRRAHAPTSKTASHDNHEKINSWVSFSFLYGYGAQLGGPKGHQSSAMNSEKMILLSMCSCSSVDRAPASCSGGHGFNPYLRRRFVFFPLSCHVAQFSFHNLFFFFKQAGFNSRLKIIMFLQPDIVEFSFLLTKLV